VFNSGRVIFLIPVNSLIPDNLLIYWTKVKMRPCRNTRYTLTFTKGQTPPVRAFWSITMYEIDHGWWFVPNPLNKFTVSPRNQLKYNPNGSLTLYFQSESPDKDKEANWLPAPKGAFIPMLRMYWPKESPPSILDGTWKPPVVTRAGS
jgi:hypothetical protein